MKIVVKSRQVLAVRHQLLSARQTVCTTVSSCPHGDWTGRTSSWKSHLVFFGFLGAVATYDALPGGLRRYGIRPEVRSSKSAHTHSSCLRLEASIDCMVSATDDTLSTGDQPSARIEAQI